jgi:PAS domain S-box-containing protein
MAEQTGQVVYDWDLETGQVHWAGAIEEVTGYPPEEFRHVTFADREQMIHPDDRKSTVEALGKAAESDGKYVEEYRLRKRDGSYVFVGDRGIMLRNEQGGPVRMLGTMKDITIRKLHAEALHVSEEKYRSIFESFQDIFYRADLEGKLQLVSPSSLSKLGYRPEELIGRNAIEFYADDPSRRALLVQRLLAEEQVSDFELRMRTKDGKVLEVSVSAHLLRDRAGEVIGYEGVLRDIGERKKMEAILRSLVKGTAARTGRQFFRSLVQSLSEGLGCKYVHVGERVGPGDRVRTLAFWSNGKFERNIEYDLSSSDCRLVTTRSMCVHAKGIDREVTSHPCFTRQGVESFIGAPLIGADDEIMGFLMIMDDQQIPDEVLGQAKSLITIAASRAAAELERVNAERELQRTCVELRSATDKLKSEHETLTERNITLKNILEHIEHEREGYKAEICASLEQALTPYVKKLQEGNGRLSTRDLGALTDLVGSIVGQGMDSFKSNYPKLSPRETEICELIMEGHPSKDISDILGISVETIHKHREVIRRKLRIQHLDINLSTYLRSKLR